MNNLLKVALVAGCVLALGAPARAQQATAETPRQITVVGTGSVSTTPDILRVNLVVQAEAFEASDAIRQMSAELEAVIATLEGAGLAARDIQTAGLRLTPRHAAKYDSSPEPELAGFIASSDVTVVVRDMNEAGGILDAVVEAGANYINNLQFDVAEPEPLLAQARGAAVADAIAKTSLYADAAALQTGAILSIVEADVPGGFNRPFAETLARDVPIALGSLEISAQVTIVTAVQ